LEHRLVGPGGGRRDVGARRANAGAPTGAPEQQKPIPEGTG